MSNITTMTAKVIRVTFAYLLLPTEGVGDQRRRTGDVGLDPGRGRGVVDDVADGVDRSLDIASP